MNTDTTRRVNAHPSRARRYGPFTWDRAQPETQHNYWRSDHEQAASGGATFDCNGEKNVTGEPQGLLLRKSMRRVVAGLLCPDGTPDVPRCVGRGGEGE